LLRQVGVVHVLVGRYSVKNINHLDIKYVVPFLLPATSVVTTSRDHHNYVEVRVGKSI